MTLLLYRIAAVVVLLSASGFSPLSVREMVILACTIINGNAAMPHFATRCMHLTDEGVDFSRVYLHNIKLN